MYLEAKMIKGQNRRAIVLIPDRTDIFDKVIFLVNPSTKKDLSENTMMQEAMRIIEANTSYKQDKKRKTGLFKRH